ncbi:hypothetical protein [Endozoicomonas sp.]|uniref:hypothetical protein n=1 Tax=Endozoicomonas sp. TaxID=1892382 RepID=UPI002888C804|nr:hypothetical protein [Endozoicomonas sp.]
MMKPPSKREALLLELLIAGRKGISQLDILSSNRFQPHQRRDRYCSWNLSSDISKLRREYGLSITRQTEAYKSNSGRVVTCKRYRIPDCASAQRIVNLINRLRRLRKAPLMECKRSSYLVSEFAGPEVMTNEK